MTSGVHVGRPRLKPFPANAYDTNTYANNTKLTATVEVPKCCVHMRAHEYV